MVVVAGTEQQQQERTFLQQLGDHAQRQTTPVVDEAFIKAFSQLSWEAQCSAMNHLYWIKQNKDRVLNDHEELVYKGRVEHLYKRWFEDQTMTWAQETLDRIEKQKALSHEEDMRLIMAEHIETVSLLLDTEGALTEQEEDPFLPETHREEVNV